jgi:hypothetical protein
VPQLVPIPWSTQSVLAQSGVVSSERMVNCFLEANPANAKGPVAIYGDAGLKAWATVGSGPIRGMLLAGTTLFVVSGVELYSVSSAGVATMRGSVYGSGRVSMIKNATQIGIATNAGFYYATIAAPSLPVLVDSEHYTSAAYQDGLGILALANSEQFWLTGLDDFSTIGGLDFSSADAFADNLVGLISDHRELLLLGEETIEAWYNSGDAAFPFARTPGGFAEVGCKAAGSIAKRSNRVFWLGSDGAVWSMSGYQPQRISTPGIERAIKALEYHDRARSFTYAVQGHEHYVLNFPDASFGYDMTTGLWRERESYGKPRWRAECLEHAFDLDLVGDYETGAIYSLDLDTHTDAGGIMRRLMQSAPLHGGGKRVLMSELYIDCSMGDSTDPAADPMAMLQWSDDGGRTWSNEMTASVGKIGEYTHRLRFNRLGSFYQRTVRLSVSDAVPLTVIGAYASLEQIAS